MTTKLEHAERLARAGFRVFPLVPNKKLPAIKDWPNQATCDLDQVRYWWLDRPTANIGIATGRGLVVIDVDVKNDAPGKANWDELCWLHDVPETFCVTTPSGGLHAYFKSEESFKNSASKLAAGIDVRAEGGFVVGPGSSIGESAYRASDASCAALPVTLTELLARPKSDDASLRLVGDGLGRERQILSAMDRPESIARAVDYLRSAEPAVEGSGGDARTVAVANGALDFGISVGQAVALLAEHWNNRCSPPWDLDDLRTKVENAARYRNDPIGVASPQAEFEPVEIKPPASLSFTLAKDVTANTDIDHLVKGYLTSKAFSVMYGQPNAGKSFIALDLSFHIATGRPWLGAPTKQGGVLYLAAEGGAGIQKRIVALRKHFNVADFPLALVRASPILSKKNDQAALIAVADAASLAMKQPLALVVVDTLNGTMEGDENSSQDMRTAIKAVKALIDKTGAHVMLVHHAGKDQARGARGHSSLKAAVDTEFEVVDGALLTNKQRDLELAERRPFKRVVVPLGVGADGDAIESCAVEWASAGDDFAEMELTPDELRCLDAIEAAMAVAGGKAVRSAAIAEHFPTPVTLRTLQRWLGALEQKGAMKRVGRSGYVVA